MFITHPWPAGAQTNTVPATEPGETAVDGGPLLVPGEAEAASNSEADTSNEDNTGTVVALVISGLLVVALLLALLTYWFWRNTRPVGSARPTRDEGEVTVRG